MHPGDFCCTVIRKTHAQHLELDQKEDAMMYPVRTTLLLSVGEETATRFLREEAVPTQPRQAGRLSQRVGFFGQVPVRLLLAVLRRFGRFERTLPGVQIGKIAPSK